MASTPTPEPISDSSGSIPPTSPPTSASPTAASTEAEQQPTAASAEAGQQPTTASTEPEQQVNPRTEEMLSTANDPPVGQNSPTLVQENTGGMPPSYIYLGETVQVPWWRTTYWEVLLLLAFSAVALLAVGLAIYVVLEGYAYRYACPWPLCHASAIRILGAMNWSVKPCDDFFEFACGSWDRLNVIPDHRTSYSALQKLDDELQATLKLFVEEPVKPNDTGAVKNLKIFYQSCVDTGVINRQQALPLFEHLTPLGGWPVANSSWREQSEGFDLTTLLLKVKRFGLPVLFKHSIDLCLTDPTVNCLQIAPGDFVLPSEVYYLSGLHQRTLVAYNAFAVAVAMALGTSENAAQTDIGDMIDFEMKLARISEINEEGIHQGSNIKLKDLMKNKKSKIDWVLYFSTFFKNISINVNGREEVVVWNLKTLQSQADLIWATDNRILANYLVWRFVMFSVEHLSQKFTDLRRDFDEELGARKPRARWRFCVDQVREHFPMAISRLFVANQLGIPDKTQRTVRLLQAVKKKFSVILYQTPWMEKNTKDFADKKLKAVFDVIDYASVVFDNHTIDSAHAQMEISPQLYFENVLTAVQVKHENHHAELRSSSANRFRWKVSPIALAPSYVVNGNAIAIPLGSFLWTALDRFQPTAVTFGGFGWTVARELTRGFDNTGRLFDADGNPKNWWTENDLTEFSEAAQCFVDQYNSYTIEGTGLRVDGQLTLDENIADHGGLEISYLASGHCSLFDFWERRLPGLGLTNNQLFFISFAQSLCGKSYADSSRDPFESEGRIPGKIRVIGTLSNSPDFAKAFRCSSGDPMNPEKKCKIW